MNAPPAPAVIRRAGPPDAATIAQVRVTAWRATYRGLMPAAYLDAMKVEESTALWQRILSAAPGGTSVFVAEDARGVFGFAAGLMLAEPRFGLDAELSAIYLDPERQRAGHGRALVAAVVEAQRAHGATGILTWVISGNRGARRFYEALGGELLVEQSFEWDGMDLVEVGYGWRDLAALGLAPPPIAAATHG